MTAREKYPVLAGGTRTKERIPNGIAVAQVGRRFTSRGIVPGSRVTKRRDVVTYKR